MQKRDPKTEEPTKIAKIYVTVYYAEKGEQMLHHFKKSMDIGNGHGGIVSQLKYDNEMKLTDEYWINYQKGKGSEEFQKYMEDLTNIKFTFEAAARDDRAEKLNMEFNTNTYPDVIMHYAPDAAKWGVEEGILIPLDDLIEANKGYWPELR